MDPSRRGSQSNQAHEARCVLGRGGAGPGEASPLVTNSASLYIYI
jgi:hypothetical protein